MRSYLPADKTVIVSVVKLINNWFDIMNSRPKFGKFWCKCFWYKLESQIQTLQNMTVLFSKTRTGRQVYINISEGNSCYQ